MDRFTFYTLAFFERLNMYDNASLSRYVDVRFHYLQNFRVVLVLACMVCLFLPSCTRLMVYNFHRVVLCKYCIHEIPLHVLRGYSGVSSFIV